MNVHKFVSGVCWPTTLLNTLLTTYTYLPQGSQVYYCCYYMKTTTHNITAAAAEVMITTHFLSSNDPPLDLDDMLTSSSSIPMMDSLEQLRLLAILCMSSSLHVIVGFS